MYVKTFRVLAGQERIIAQHGRQGTLTAPLSSGRLDDVAEKALHDQELQQTTADAVAPDPAVGLRAVAALRHLLENLERLQVDSARGKGWSWRQIAEALGVSKQAVHEKHASRFAKEEP